MDVEREYVESHPEAIDEEWQRSIERLIGGLAAHLNEDQRVMLVEDTEEAANLLRERLLSSDNYFDAHGLARLMFQHSMPVTANEIDVLRQGRYLVGVPDHDKWLFPRFQFHPQTGDVSPLVRRVSEEFSDRDSSWTQLAWWFDPHPLLDGARPADILHSEESESILLEALQVNLGRTSTSAA